MRRYTSFVRLKASSYFLAGGDSEDLIQEGLVGLYKAVRDFRPDKETSFRSFAELCVTRQIITAIKTATRFKHAPLNSYVSFSPPGGQDGDDCTLGDALPGPSVNDPSVGVISTEELQSLVGCLSTTLSPLEADALRLYLEGSSYEEMAEELGCDTKTIDNALQRVKRKIITHQRAANFSRSGVRFRRAGVAQLVEQLLVNRRPRVRVPLRLLVCSGARAPARDRPRAPRRPRGRPRGGAGPPGSGRPPSGAGSPSSSARRRGSSRW